jgi:hypothetical protein
MDADLRNSLWSAYYDTFLSSDMGSSNTDPGRYIAYSRHQHLIRALWLTFFKLPSDKLPFLTKDLYEQVRDWFFKAEWYLVYDFVEFVARASSSPASMEFIKRCNLVLEREVSGFRLISGVVTPITDQSEIAAIESALDDAQSAGFAGVQEHLRTALTMLSDREKPDYRNSIKESISAVESIAKIVAADPAADLTKALQAIESRSKVPLHGALKAGFIKLYAYTSDEGGIRHALLDEPVVDFADAKYMLATCAAFVNLLIIRAAAAGISLADTH